MKEITSLLPFTKAEATKLERIGCDKRQCRIRKVSLTSSDGPKKENLYIFIYVDVLGAIGPQKRSYGFTSLDVTAVDITANDSK